MPYSDLNVIQDPTIGVPVSEAWFDQVRLNQEYFARNRPHCRVFNSAHQGIGTSGSETPLSFDSERFDVGGCHSGGSPTRLTCPTGEGGVYLIGGHVDWAGNNQGTRHLHVRLNTNTLIASNSPQLSGTIFEIRQHVVTLYALVPGDYITLNVYQDSGSTVNVQHSANYSPEFWMMWMSL